MLPNQIATVRIEDPDLARQVDSFLFEEVADLLERLEGQGYSRAELYMSLKRLDRGEPVRSNRWAPRSHWDEHPVHPSSIWKEEVAEDATRQSYVQWVESRRQDRETMDLPSPSSLPELMSDDPDDTQRLRED